MTTKNSSAIAILTLLANNCQTIGVRFKDHAGEAIGSEYTYKAPKDMTLGVGDHVVVNAPSTGPTAVIVTSVHEELNIDVEAPFNYTWIMCKVKSSTYQANLDKDDAIRERVEKLQEKAKRASAMQKLMDEFGLDETGVQELLADLA